MTLSMTKKIVASGIIILILGIIMIVLPKTNIAQIDESLFYIIGHTMVTLGLVLVTIVLAKKISDRL